MYKKSTLAKSIPFSGSFSLPSLGWFSRAALCWLGFFILALFAALITPLEIPGGLTLNSSAEHAAVAFGGDVGHYIDYADSMLETGRVDAIQMQRIFPPGTSLFIAAVFKTLGRDNYLWHMLFISAALWASALCFAYRALTFIRSPLLRFLAINSIWLFHTFTDWGLKTGSFFSEAKSMPFFLIALASLAIAIRERKPTFWITALLAMTAATYTRVYFETVGHFIFLGVFLATSFNWIQRKRLPDSERTLALKDWRWSLGVLVFFSATLMPWKLLNKHTGNGYAMCPAHYWMTFHNLWIPSEQLPEFIIAGNSACVADPELCKIFQTIREEYKQDISLRVYKTAALATLVTRAGRWYAHRGSHFWKFWADFPGPSSSISKFRSNLEGYLVIALAILSIILSLFQLRHPGPSRIWAAAVLAFTLQSFIMFTLAGMDYRHSFPVRLFFFTAIPLAFAVLPQFSFSLGRGFKPIFQANRERSMTV